MISNIYNNTSGYPKKKKKVNYGRQKKKKDNKKRNRAVQKIHLALSDYVKKELFIESPGMIKKQELLTIFAQSNLINGRPFRAKGKLQERIVQIAKALFGEQKFTEFGYEPREQKTQVKKKTVDVKTDEFLNSYQWRKVRYEALLKYGKQCMCCGNRPPDCVIHVDHIKPRRFYPELALELSNLQILCHECNHGKGNWDETDHRPLG